MMNAGVSEAPSIHHGGTSRQEQAFPEHFIAEISERGIQRGGKHIAAQLPDVQKRAV